MAGHSSVSYQFSVRTSRPPEAVLDELATRGFAGISVAERGSSYLVLRPRARYRYKGETAIAVAIAMLIVILILTAITPLFIVLLPLALTPAIPFFFLERRPMLAVSAVPDADETATRLTVHGQASPELTAALDAYMATLPAAEPAAAAGKEESPPPVTPRKRRKRPNAEGGSPQ